MGLKDCCQKESEVSLEKHKDIAVCDVCGNLLLAYADEDTYQLTVDELGAKGASFDVARAGALWVVSKER